MLLSTFELREAGVIVDDVYVKHTASHMGNAGTQTLYFKGVTEILLSHHQGALMVFTATLPTLGEYALAMAGKIKMFDIGVLNWDPNLFGHNPTPLTNITAYSGFQPPANSGETEAHQFRGDG